MPGQFFVKIKLGQALRIFFFRRLRLVLVKPDAALQGLKTFVCQCSGNRGGKFRLKLFPECVDVGNRRLVEQEQIVQHADGFTWLHRCDEDTTARTAAR